MALESRRKIQNLLDATYLATGQQLSKVIKERVFSQPKEAWPAQPERDWLCRLSFWFLNCFWNKTTLLIWRRKSKAKQIESDVNSNVKLILKASDLGYEVNEVKFEQNPHTAWNVLMKFWRDKSEQIFPWSTIESWLIK